MKKGKQYWLVIQPDGLPAVLMVVYQGRGEYTIPPLTWRRQLEPKNIFLTEKEALRQAIRRCREHITEYTDRADELSRRLESL